MDSLIAHIFDEMLNRWPNSEGCVVLNSIGESKHDYTVTFPGYPDRFVEMDIRDHGIAILVQVIDNTNRRNNRFEVMSIDHDRLFQRYHGVKFQVDDQSGVSHVVDNIGLAIGVSA